MKGLFVTFEGIDGSGKTTNMEEVANELTALALHPIMTFQPGQTILGANLRKLLKDINSKFSPLTELMLFQADRADHHQHIKKWLEDGSIVLCDRYTDSTLAYQGYGRGLDFHLIEYLNNETTEGLKPDLTILLDIHPKTAQGRLALKKGESTDQDRFDDEKFEFHSKLREGFLKIAEAEPSRFLVLNSLAGKGTLKAYAVSEVLKRLREKQNA